MYDSFGRKIDYLRISITNKCNLNCKYCSTKFKEINKFISNKDIVNIAKVANNFKFKKIRFTGGEPFVRKDFINILYNVRKVYKNDISITTNGIHLFNYLKDLIKIGIYNLNVSLDTLNIEKYETITGKDYLNSVLKSLLETKKYGFNIKLNVVLSKYIDRQDLKDISKFAKNNNFAVQFIREFNLQDNKFYPVINGNGGRCYKCNRIRILSNGDVIPCLFSGIKYNIYEIGIYNAINLSIITKPLYPIGGQIYEIRDIGG